MVAVDAEDRLYGCGRSEDQLYSCGRTHAWPDSRDTRVGPPHYTNWRNNTNFPTNQIVAPCIGLSITKSRSHRDSAPTRFPTTFSVSITHTQVSKDDEWVVLNKHEPPHFTPRCFAAGGGVEKVKVDPLVSARCVGFWCLGYDRTSALRTRQFT